MRARERERVESVADVEAVKVSALRKHMSWFSRLTEFQNRYHAMCVHRLFTLALTGLVLEIASLSRLSGFRPALNAHLSLSCLSSGVWCTVAPKYTLKMYNFFTLDRKIKPTGICKQIMQKMLCFYSEQTFSNISIVFNYM